MNKPIQNNHTKTQSQYAIIELQQISQFCGLSGADIQVFLTYKAHQNKETGLSWPSVKTIQQYTLLSRSSVMRAIRRLKQSNFIIPTTTKHKGVVAYSFGTGVNIDTGVKSDTGANIDTSQVSDLVHKQVKEQQITNPITASTDHMDTGLAELADDDKLFLLLWEKWNTQKICQWSSMTGEPLKEYRQAKHTAMQHLKSKGITKDWCNELQCIDIFLMQQLIKARGNNQRYEGPAKLWSGVRWCSGIQKWLMSETPSYINASKQRLQPYAICLSRQTTEAAIAEPSRHQERVQDTKIMSEDVQDFINTLNGIFSEFYETQDESVFNAAYEVVKEDMQQRLTPEQIDIVLKGIE